MNRLCVRPARSGPNPWRAETVSQDSRVPGQTNENFRYLISCSLIKWQDYANKIIKCDYATFLVVLGTLVSPAPLYLSLIPGELVA